MNREEALALLKKYVKTEANLHHALAVAGVMGYFARYYGEEGAKWELAGLLHDLDYEMYPEEHCQKVAELLKGEDVGEDTVRAIQSHGYGLCSDVKPETNLEKTLYTIDELTGLINAAAIMRPSKSVMDLEVSSLKKKFKDKRFAAGVNRDVILEGAGMLGLELDKVMEMTILGMREVAEEIGLG